MCVHTCVTLCVQSLVRARARMHMHVDVCMHGKRRSLFPSPIVHELLCASLIDIFTLILIHFKIQGQVMHISTENILANGGEENTTIAIK